jgi:hypothetical protein
VLPQNILQVNETVDSPAGESRTIGMTA